MYISANFDKFKHIYDIKRLKQYSDMCERDIKRLEEIIEKLKEYQMGIFEHAQTVMNTEFTKSVRITRSSRGYSNSRVMYHVQLILHPIVSKEWIENEKIYGSYEHEKTFSGRERHSALKYASELARKYNCEIERKGFNAGKI